MTHSLWFLGERAHKMCQTCRKLNRKVLKPYLPCPLLHHAPFRGLPYLLKDLVLRFFVALETAFTAEKLKKVKTGLKKSKKKVPNFTTQICPSRPTFPSYGSRYPGPKTYVKSRQNTSSLTLRNGLLLTLHFLGSMTRF